MNLGAPNSIEIKPNEDKTRFRFLLRGCSGHARQPVEFDVNAESLMALMRGLQRLQEFHKIPIPPNLRPRGKPHLVVVS